MIQEFVDRFMENRKKLEKQFYKKRPKHFINIVKAVVEILYESDTLSSINPEKIYEIDDEEVPGTLIYVIGTTDSIPDICWYVKVAYGSCSVCDAIMKIQSKYQEEKYEEEEVKDYMTLALHIVQGMKEMDGKIVYD